MAAYQNQMDQRPAIHVVDDDHAVRDSMGLMLEIEGFVVRTYASAAAFLREARLEGNCCLIVDLHMPGLSGVALLDQLQRNGINVPAIVMTGMVSESICRAAEQVSAAVLEKPYHLREVVHSIETAVRFSRRTFAGATGNGQGALTPDLRPAWSAQ